MLKQIIIISIFLSFCFGQQKIEFSMKDMESLKKNKDNMINMIEELNSTIETLILDGNNLGTTEESTDAMIVTILDLVKSYEKNINNLAAEIAKTENRKKQLENEMSIHQEYRNGLDSMRVNFENKLSELANKHRDVTNFRDEMEVELSKEPKGSLEEEKGE
jgi:chromosome segregation ATPase